MAARRVISMEREDIRKREHRDSLEYMKTRSKYEGFRACGYLVGLGYTGLAAHFCDDEKSPCCDLVFLYAKMGLHLYNLLQGKELQLMRVKKYNKTVGGGCVISSYYITCKSKDPAATRGSVRTFQAVVRERAYNRFVLTCDLARIVGKRNGEKTKKHGCDNKPLIDFMPELPAENPFEEDGDTTRFYVFKEKEVQEKDWIRLYLELAVATSNKQRDKRHALTNLKILKVAMDLNVPIFYIRYEDSCEARVGKDVDRVAIVRRILDEDTGSLHLVGCNQSIIIASAAMEAGSSSARD